jgi:hypothetical protein
MNQYTPEEAAQIAREAAESIKRCARCGAVKSVDHFYRLKTGRLHSYCKTCVKIYNAKYDLTENGIALRNARQARRLAQMTGDDLVRERARIRAYHRTPRGKIVNALGQAKRRLKHFQEVVANLEAELARLTFRARKDREGKDKSRA